MLAKPTAKVTLRRLGTKGLGGGKEPSLQYIFDTWQIPVKVGDAKPQNAPLGTPTAASQEVSALRFARAGAGPVTFEVLASFGPPQSNPIVHRFGWYPAGNKNGATEVDNVDGQFAQVLDPPINGPHNFTPGSEPFGLWTEFPAFKDAGQPRRIYQEEHSTPRGSGREPQGARLPRRPAHLRGGLRGVHLRVRLPGRRGRRAQRHPGLSRAAPGRPSRRPGRRATPRCRKRAPGRTGRPQGNGEGAAAG